MLHVMHWNAQGITTHSAISQLEQFIRKNNIDIVLLNETFLKPHHKFLIVGYKVYRRDRPTHGGGVLIAIRNCLEHKLLRYDKTFDIENISISIDLNGRTTIITSAYCPQFSDKFKKDLDVLTNKSTEFFIFGDFNAHHTSWNCSLNNQAGNVLFNHQNQSNYYVFYPTNNTRFDQTASPSPPSTIDIMLSNSSLSFSNLETHPNELVSDHVPVTCYIYGNIQGTSNKIPLYHLADWNSIRRWVDNEIQVQNLISEDLTNVNIDSIFVKAISISNNAYRKIPVGNNRDWKNNISDLMINLIRQRKKYQRKLQRCSDYGRRQTLISILKQLRSLIDFHINRDRNENWSTFIKKLPTGSKQFWKLTKTFKCKRFEIPSLKLNGHEYNTNEDKANIIADVFEQSHKITLNNHTTMDKKVQRHTQSLYHNNEILLEQDALTKATELIEISITTTIIQLQQDNNSNNKRTRYK
ncbi:uncharacterized protein LOC135961480 [Calliphora vicina]|uniref:uncharacterized protein LOC135961480 n=1 Tax=Calliphora vicina TaxID=7373 RepID=UPI00325C28B7